MLLLVFALFSVTFSHDRQYAVLDLKSQVMAFDNRLPGDTNPSLYLTTGKGRKYLRLTDGTFSARVPEISPDGNWIAFVGDKAGNEDIFVMRIDGGGLRQLTQHQGKDSYPRFSPDGKRVAFFSDRNGETKIFSVDSAVSAAPKQITSGRGNDFDPMFSPDGSAIYFTSDRSGKMAIYRTALDDGAGSKRHPSLGPNDRFAYYQSVLEPGNAKILATDIATGQIYRLGKLSGASLNPTVKASEAASTVRKNGLEVSCGPPVIHLWRSIRKGPRAVAAFLRNFRLFREICHLPSV